MSIGVTYVSNILFKDISSIVSDDNGNLYVANYSPNSNIVKVDSNKNVSVLANYPHGVIAGLVYVNGYIYATDYSNNAVYEVNASNGDSTTFVNSNTPGMTTIRNPRGITYYNGFLYVVYTLPNHGRVHKINIRNVEDNNTFADITGTDTYNITTDPSGNFYVTYNTLNPDQGYVAKYNSEGTNLDNAFITMHHVPDEDTYFSRTILYNTNPLINEQIAKGPFFVSDSFNDVLFYNNNPNREFTGFILNQEETPDNGGMTFDSAGNFYYSSNDGYNTRILWFPATPPANTNPPYFGYPVLTPTPGLGSGARTGASVLIGGPRSKFGNQGRIYAWMKNHGQGPQYINFLQGILKYGG